jgi:hypothetical protein
MLPENRNSTHPRPILDDVRDLPSGQTVTEFKREMQKTEVFRRGHRLMLAQTFRMLTKDEAN